MSTPAQSAIDLSKMDVPTEQVAAGDTERNGHMVPSTGQYRV